MLRFAAVVSLGRYTLLRRVGAGGMAEIWKARTKGPAGFSKVVAIKRVLPEFAADEEFIEMFVEEAKLVARLVHPNIVQVFDFNEAKGDGEVPEYFITMEYVAGQNLATILKKLKAPLPLPVALYVVMEAARGLAHAHEEKDDAGQPLGIVHRDISPHNLLVSWKGEVKVADFGIAKVASVSRTATGIMKGKVAYMSPEQAKLEMLDHRSDLFSLGVVLWETLAGGRLFSERSSEEIYRKVLTFTLPDVSRFPEAVRAVLAKSLQPDREQRYASARDMEADLLGVLGAQGIAGARAELQVILAKLFANEQQQELNDTKRPVDAPPVVGALPEDSRRLAAPPPIQENTGPARSLIGANEQWMDAIENAEADPGLLTNVGGESVRGGTAMSAKPLAAPPPEEEVRGDTKMSAQPKSLDSALNKFGEAWKPEAGGAEAGPTAIKQRGTGGAATALRPGGAPAPADNLAGTSTQAVPAPPRHAALAIAGAALGGVALAAGLWLGGFFGSTDGTGVTVTHTPVASPSGAAVAAPSPSPAGTATKTDRLRSLDSLLRDGLISEEDYQRRRKEILDEI